MASIRTSRGRTPARVAPDISEHIEHLELATVLNALQAVSGEIVPERLIETLLRMSLEHAGAERGAAAPGRGRPADSGGSHQRPRNVDRSSPRGPARADDLAESVVQYVARTQESVILNDASCRTRSRR